MIKELIQRNLIGEIKIKENFYLPHIKTDTVEETYIINVEGFLNNKVLFILIPNKKYNEDKENIIKIISKLDEEEFEKYMEYSEDVFTKYIENIIL